MAIRLLSTRSICLRSKQFSRSLASAVTPSSSTPNATPADTPLTHYKITFRRSAISLGDKIKGTVEALGIHRRNQTVYHPHGPEVAGKILAIKELVEVENVPEHMVKNAQEQRRERRAKRGYTVVGSRSPSRREI